MMKNKATFAIIIFAITFYVIQLFKPSFLYNVDGSLRQFGLGFQKKTVFPIWLLSFILAIFSYLFVLYFITFPKILY